MPSVKVEIGTPRQCPFVRRPRQALRLIARRPVARKGCAPSLARQSNPLAAQEMGLADATLKYDGIAIDSAAACTRFCQAKSAVLTC